MRSKYYLWVLLCFNTLLLNAQIEDITFRRISPPGGFSFQAIDVIEQDLFGYIWMGGFDGVIRYDSKKIVRFRHDPEADNGLPSDRITAIVIDRHNNIWVGTDKGLCLFNPTLQQFEIIDYAYENGEAANTHIYSMALDGSSNLWIADQNYFGFLNKENNTLVRLTEGLSNPPRLLYNDETNRLWLGTNNGSVYLVLPDEKRVEMKIDGLDSITRTIYVNNKEIWVGYESHGARLYNLDGKLLTHYAYPLNPEFDLKTASIRKIWRDTRARIWIGSYLGLFLIDGTKLIHFDQDRHDGLPHNSIYEIFEDRQGGIWIGTWSGGISYLHHADNKFSNYRHSKDSTSLSHNMVSSFVETPRGDILVGTERNGLNKFDSKTETFRKVKVLDHEGILNIKALCVDNQGGLWVGSAFSGLYYRRKGTTKFVNFARGEEDGQHISSEGVYAFCNSDSGVWIGTNLGGLNFYNFEDKQISFKANDNPYFKFHNQGIRSLTIDSKGNMWAGTLNGMYRVHLPSGELTSFGPNSISNHKTKSSVFYYVCELSDGKIWMGTKGDGINIYDPNTEKVNSLYVDGLLKGKDVYGIIEGRNNNTWITTSDGLILYNVKANTSRRFIITDGIQGNLFNPRAVFKDSEEHIYLGGTNGFTQIEPGKVKENTRAPNVLISNMQVNDRRFVPSQTAVNQFSQMILNPDETTVKFDFSADNYLLSEKNRFMYRLINYVDEWVHNDTEGSVTFINLPPGKYVFEVRACNNDGVWNEIPARLPFAIKQFWYKSDIALSMYFVAVIAILIFSIRFFRERARLKKVILIEKIERNHADQLHEMKLRFFTNISHEFRTPLTLINWPLKKLLEAKNLTAEQVGKLESVKRNTNRLLYLINQIMDLRKVERGQAKLNISNIELVGFVNERVLGFVEEAKSKDIHLTFEKAKSEVFIDADEEKLDKIIYNLLSNAFKHAPAGGRVSVSIKHNDLHNSIHFSNQLSFGAIDFDDFVEMAVTDDGPGIDSEDLPRIFDRFEQGKRKKGKEHSTGIGLTLCKEFTLLHQGIIVAQSTPGAGTRFAIRLPKKQKAQKILYESHREVKNINTWQSREKPNSPEEIDSTATTILLVEDNEDLRKYLIEFLKDNYSLVYAEDGKQALDILKTRNVQLVISDVMMPVMDGFEFCQIVKSQIETSHIPVILLTALSSSENTSTGLEKGADAYISKPFDANVLLSQIKNLLEQRKRLQENYLQKYMTRQPIDVGSLDNYFLNRVNTAIEKNIENDKFTVDSLASEMGLSRSQLHRKLKQVSDHSTSEYITMVKIKKATSLLASKKYNIDEVAFKSGFNSHSYFNKCFKKIHHKSPKEFLKQL
jgi:signal transduction histidine kinase/ligand-binding sensor domain-containing protein/DNA-binding response OmpR family regulator